MHKYKSSLCEIWQPADDQRNMNFESGSEQHVFESGSEFWWFTQICI